MPVVIKRHRDANGEEEGQWRIDLHRAGLKQVKDFLSPIEFPLAHRREPSMVDSEIARCREEVQKEQQEKEQGDRACDNVAIEELQPEKLGLAQFAMPPETGNQIGKDDARQKTQGAKADQGQS